MRKKKRTSDISPRDREASLERQRQIERHIADTERRLSARQRSLDDRIAEIEREFLERHAGKAS